MSANLFVKLGLSSLMIVVSTGLALGDSKNYAQQLELKNCGGYRIAKIVLQRKAVGDGHWALIEEWLPTGTKLTNGQTFCVDVSGYSQFKSGDQARLKAYIDAGDTQTCDGTNYGDSKKPRRKLEMAGTITVNNACRSQNYKSARPASECKTTGTYHYEGPCS